MMAPLLCACSLDQKQMVTKTAEEQPALTVEQEKAITPTVGLQNLRQILETRVVLTGIQPDSGILDLYERSKTLFSLDGDALSVNGSMLLAIGALGGAFCDRLIDEESSRSDSSRKVFQGVNFNASLANLSSGARGTVIKNLFSSFLQREESEEEKTVLLSAIEEVSRAAAGITATREAMMVACSTVLGSLDTIQN